MSSNPRPGFAAPLLYKSLPASILRFPVSVIAPSFSLVSILISLFHLPSSTSFSSLLFFLSVPLLHSIQPTFHVLSFLSLNVDSFRSFAHSPAQ
ncbi:uncharacterized protein ASPGLDRAFT_1189801 [Aspergillus glaucus CBS 516.65]|uniref:Uncharacterized protein n=1 Tax=Aspergillus glaucus CBS 516.65 TaxID=1160497 RepID=A0A1L9V4H7_ASPGL|nr:hypothetical protein ASPGLDRAFT_1189801 [Aspergillus glaucus CBS 516.65]OJJ78742.1 hypothetical protein ASPGLDRAFT_1189801 [Aspergillus glaucus CBS 516.65]